MIYLDTHVVVWLYAGRTDLLSPRAAERIEGEPLRISPIVQLELEYLHEIDRVTVGSALIVETLATSIGLEVCGQPFAWIVVESIGQRWTRDPFDRIIVAHAIVGQASLVTKDASIRANYQRTVW